jgi:hypothetical protein
MQSSFADRPVPAQVAFVTSMRSLVRSPSLCATRNCAQVRFSNRPVIGWTRRAPAPSSRKVWSGAASIRSILCQSAPTSSTRSASTSARIRSISSASTRRAQSFCARRCREGWVRADFHDGPEHQAPKRGLIHWCETKYSSLTIFSCNARRVHTLESSVFRLSTVTVSGVSLASHTSLRSRHNGSSRSPMT